jgi:hypothetical protein
MMVKSCRVTIQDLDGISHTVEMLAGSDGSYVEAKRQCAKSRTAVALQRMIEVHAPEKHFFGHYHRRWTTKHGHTTFRCLKELEICEACPANPLVKRTLIRG